MLPLTLADIRAAAERLTGIAQQTPVLTSTTLDRATGSQVFLKCENFQRTGAFKLRGAYNAISQLTTDERARGVAAFSSGNHAQAVAHAATLLETKATIVMPEDTPATKLTATREYGAQVVTFDRYSEDREAVTRKVAEQHGYVVIPPYDDPRVMAGQGTVALELLSQVDGLDALLAPIGGGGLMAGCATAATALSPSIEVIGVEPEHLDDTSRSLAAGQRVAVPTSRTIADGLAVETPGELTFAVNQKLLSSVAVVTEDQIRAAMRFAFERLKLVIEPSGAVGLAALLSGLVSLPHKRIGVVISGGNIGVDRFAELLG